MNFNTSERNVIGGSVLTPGLVDLQKFMFSDRYHLRASTLARVHGMDNVFQSLYDFSFAVAAECLPEGKSHVL